MRYAKTIAALVTALAMIAVLGACGASTEIVPAEETAAAETVAETVEETAEETAEGPAEAEAGDASDEPAPTPEPVDPAEVAATIGGEDYTVAQMNYYYSSSVMSFYNEYYEYIMYGMAFDPSVPLSEQEYSEGVTWRDYFLENTIASIEEIRYLNEQATAEGFVLPESYEQAYAASLERTRSDWAEYGYDDLETFLAENYGPGVTMELIEQELYSTYVAAAYSDALWDSFSFTPEEITAYTAEHADDFDTVRFSYAIVEDGSLVAESGDADGAEKALQGATEEEFAAYAEGLGLESYTEAFSYSNLPASLAAWLFDADRAPGDAAAIPDEEFGGTFLVLFHEREVNDDPVVAFRHILIRAEDTDEDGVYSGEELAAAEARVHEIYDEWAAGEATEESFGELADLYSDDAGSNTAGGLYEQVTPGSMVEPIDEWLFDASRAPGDTTIVTFDGHYTGAHAVYFVGKSDMTYAMTVAEQTMRREAYAEVVTPAYTAYDVSYTDALSGVGTMF